MSRHHAGLEHAAAFTIYFAAAFAAKSLKLLPNKLLLRDLKSG